MKKRITALLLCCVMLLTLCPGLISTATAYDDTQPDQAEATGETVQPTVNFTNVAPFLPPVSGGVRMLRAPLAAANYAANDAANFAATDNGMKISKTATRNDGGSYTITLEAYATGSKVITEQKTDIPTDIILVLDQSGSMANDIGTVSFEQYKDESDRWGNITYHTRNQDYYKYRHNGGSANLWHKLSDDSYVSVSVTAEEKISHLPIDTTKNNRYYWENQNNLYARVNGEYVKVNVKRTEWYGTYTYTLSTDGSVIGSGDGYYSSPDFSGIEGNQLYLAGVDENNTVYIYTYTDKDRNVQTIGTSTGAETVFDKTLYRRNVNTSGGESRLDALKTAATNFANQVALKAKGKDGIVGTGDDVKHRIAVVGYAGSSSNLTNGFKQMINTSQAADVSSAIDKLKADGGTHIDQGLSTANGIFANNPIGDTENRNRVVIVFTDGAPGSYGDWCSESVQTANNAIAYAKTAKKPTSEGGYGATVYTIGIFSGADASNPDSLPAYTSYTTGWFGSEQSPSEADQVKNSNRFMHLVSSNYPDASSITEPGSINPNLNGKSYYLSAADSVALNNIFQQISEQIESGGSSTTLDANAEIRDVVSNAFTMPENTTDINLYTAESNGSTDSWKSRVSFNGTTLINESKRTISVSGFSFKDNWCGNEETNGQTTFHDGKKLIIEFTVKPENGFLGGNNVYTNAGAGVYENSDVTQPVLSFPQPQVNVPIKNVTVSAQDKNVYLLGNVTAEQLKAGAEVSCGGVTLDLSKADENYGLESWQTEYVDITVEVKDADGNVISDKLENLTEDTTYTVAVTVAPKTTGTTSEAKGEAATAKSGENNPAANVNVFTPEVNFKDSTIYRGNTADYSINQTDTPVWKHGNTVDSAVDMIGTAPTLTYSYDKDKGAFEDCTDVNVTVKIGSTDVTDKTTGDKLFTVHVLQPVITATVNDVERYYGESYTLGNGANGAIDLTWTDNHNHSAIPDATDTMPYDVNDLSLAYSATAFSGTVPASDFDVTVKVMKGDEVMHATITTKCDYGCSAAQTDDKYTVHVKTCTLTVKKSGCSDLDYHAANNTGNAEYQSFIFEVNGDEDNNVQIAPIKVTVQGNGEVKIVGLPTGTYTVTENQGWSWRYTPDEGGAKDVTVNGGVENTVTFTNTRTNPYWLSGDNFAINKFSPIAGQNIH